MTTTRFDPDIALQAPINGPIIRLIITELADGEPHSRRDLGDLANPKTVANLISGLAHTGILERTISKHRHYARLTLLGQQWAADRGILTHPTNKEPARP